MVKRVVAGALLASMCLLLLLVGDATAGEKTNVVRICTPDDAKGEIKVVVESDTDRAWLGVGIQDLDSELRDSMGIDKKTSGVFVNEIYDDSPAEAAGLEYGDVVLSIGSGRTDNVKALIGVMNDRKPGDEVDITVLRDGKEQLMMAKLGSRPQETIIEKGPFLSSLEGLRSLAVLGDMALPWLEIGLAGSGGRGRLGIYIDDLSEGLAEYFEVPDGKGVLVKEIVDDSPAEKAGMKAGDIIIKVAGTGVADRASLVEAISDMEPDVETPIVVVRKGKELTLSAVVGESDYDKAMKEYEQQIQAHAEELGQMTRAKALVIDESTDELRKELAKLREELKEMKKELKEIKKD